MVVSFVFEAFINPGLKPVYWPFSLMDGTDFSAIYGIMYICMGILCIPVI